jgi:hypothetical protein
MSNLAGLHAALEWAGEGDRFFAPPEGRARKLGLFNLVEVVSSMSYTVSQESEARFLRNYLI